MIFQLNNQNIRRVHFFNELTAGDAGIFQVNTFFSFGQRA